MRKWLLTTVLLIISLLFAAPVFAEGRSYDTYTKEAGTNALEAGTNTSETGTYTKETGKVQSNPDKRATTPQVTGTVDLRPYKPSNWGDSLIVSKTLGQRYSDTSFSPNDELFVSHAFDNNGTTDSPYATIINQVYVDNTLKLTGAFQGIVDTTSYYSMVDKSIGKLSPGIHTIKMVLDTTNAVAESNENNNEYSITINVVSSTVDNVDLSPYKPSNWGDSLIVSKTLGQRYSDTSFSPDDELFISQAFDNNGTADSPYATIINQLYVDNTLKFTGTFQGIVDTNSYYTLVDKSIGKLSAGTHTIKMVLDATNAVAESNENNNEYSITINVVSGTQQQPVVVSVSPTTINLNNGDTKWLTTTTTPSNSAITYRSEDDSVATVNSLGLITATGVGSTTITVTASAAGYTNGTATVAVTVTESTQTVESLSAEPSALTLSIGETSDPIILMATYTDGSTEDVTESATWKSSKPSVATVDEYGTVTGVKKGSTTVTATYGGETATVTINVTPELDYILAQPESVSVIYGKTQAVKIYAVYLDKSKEDITKAVTLESDDPETATVTGGVIKGVSVGDTTVRGTYLDQDIEIPVTVTAPVTKLTADPAVLNVSLDGTETITLTATYKDGSENDVTECSTWKSSKPSIATVDEYGTVTGLAVGSTKITATYGGKTATINVTVTPELDYILVQPGSVGVAKGKTQAVTIYAVYADGSKADITKTVRLTSDDPSVATVTGATIKGITADCETTVTGTYFDQDIVIPVKVTPPVKTLIADTDTSGLNLIIGDSETITLTATYADGSSEDVNGYATGISSKPGVATVDIADGSITVTGVAKGSATITLMYEGKKVTVKVNVTAY